MAAPCVPGRTFPQFDDHPLEARNCGVSVTRSLVQFGSHGLVSPTAAEIRSRMGGITRWTRPSDAKKAVESYDREMLRRGLKPLRYKLVGKLVDGLYRSGATRADLVARIKRLEMVHLAIDYGRVNDTRPSLSGSPGFRAGHAIWIGGGTPKRPGWRMRRGTLEVRYSDSTWGRAGTPKAAPQWVPLAWVWQTADGAWSSRGGTGWVGGSVACSPHLTKPPAPTPKPPPAPDPVPEPDPDPCEDIVADLQARLDATEEELSAALVLLGELRQRIPDAEVLERLRQLRDDIDQLLPTIDDDTALEQGMETPE